MLVVVARPGGRGGESDHVVVDVCASAGGRQSGSGGTAEGIRVSTRSVGVEHRVVKAGVSAVVGPEQEREDLHTREGGRRSPHVVGQVERLVLLADRGG